MLVRLVPPVDAAGALSCWGTDSSGLGLLGTGVAGASQAQPALVDQPAGASWAALDVGGSFSCAARADDSSLWCWVRAGAGRGFVGRMRAAEQAAAGVRCSSKCR